MEKNPEGNRYKEGKRHKLSTSKKIVLKCETEIEIEKAITQMKVTGSDLLDELLDE